MINIYYHTLTFFFVFVNIFTKYLRFSTNKKKSHKNAFQGEGNLFYIINKKNKNTNTLQTIIFKKKIMNYAFINLY